jgi:hypothetical protein
MGGRLFRRPKLTLSCSAEGKEGRKEGRRGGEGRGVDEGGWGKGREVSK